MFYYSILNFFKLIFERNTDLLSHVFMHSLVCNQRSALQTWRTGMALQPTDLSGQGLYGTSNVKVNITWILAWEKKEEDKIFEYMQENPDILN